MINKIINFYKLIKNNIMLQIITCVILSIIVLTFSIILYNVIPIKYNISVSDYIKLINQIEDIKIENNEIKIKGFAFMLDTDSDDTKINILLRNTRNGKEIWADVKQIYREDVNAYFNCEYNYGNSGFYAAVKEKKIKSEECYEIIVILDYVITGVDNNGKSIETKLRKAVSSNRYIINGEMYCYNPYEFNPLDMNIKSDLLNDVINYGILCFYNKDIGIYVYQYDDKLYWLTDEIFEFKNDGKTYIQYQLETSRTDKLPDHRIQYGFDNIGFYFEEYEYVDENIKPYRVAIRDIPDNYPITYILTGMYDSVNNDWVWKKHFQIYHNFN